MLFPAVARGAFALMLLVVSGFAPLRGKTDGQRIVGALTALAVLFFVPLAMTLDLGEHASAQSSTEGQCSRAQINSFRPIDGPKP